MNEIFKRKEMLLREVMKKNTREEQIREIKVTYLAAKANYEEYDMGLLDGSMLKQYKSIDGTFHIGDMVKIRKNISLLNFGFTNSTDEHTKIALHLQEKGRKGKIREFVGKFESHNMVMVHFKDENGQSDGMLMSLSEEILQIVQKENLEAGDKIRIKKDAKFDVRNKRPTLEERIEYVKLETFRDDGRCGVVKETKYGVVWVMFDVDMKSNVNENRAIGLSEKSIERIDDK